MHKIHLNLKSFDLNSLRQIENYLFSIFSFFNLDKIQKKWSPQECKKITVLRSPHIDKKSREQFQITTYKRTLVLTLSEKNSVFFLLEILKNSKFVGIEFEILLDYSTF